MIDTKVYQKDKFKIIISTEINKLKENDEKINETINLGDTNCYYDREFLECTTSEISGTSSLFSLTSTEISSDKYVSYHEDKDLEVTRTVKIINLINQKNKNLEFLIPSKNCNILDNELKCDMKDKEINLFDKSNKITLDIKDKNITTLEFSGNDNNSAYTFSGERISTLSLCKNLPYIFKPSANHPMYIETDKDTRFSEFNFSPNIIFGAIGTYTYRCLKHPNMNGRIKVVDCF